MALLTYYNGEFKRENEAFIPLCDRAVFFGDGIYDAALSKNGKIFMLSEHIERFISNAEALEISLPMSRDRLSDLLYEIAFRCASSSPLFLYFQLSRFGAERAHAADDRDRSNLLITASEISLPTPSDTLALIGCEDRRHGICNIKTLNLILSCRAARQARERGADEAVFLRNGTVTECSHSNVHIIKDGILLTHPADENILPGISRKHMLSVARELEIPIIEKGFSENELLFADEVLVTSTSKLALRARTYENRRYDTSEGTLGDKICLKMRRDFDIFTK